MKSPRWKYGVRENHRVEFMRIFGSKVIALNKGLWKGKFEFKGELYLLVGYSEEAKAYFKNQEQKSD